MWKYQTKDFVTLQSAITSFSQHLQDFVVVSKVQHHGMVLPTPDDGRAVCVPLKLEALNTHALKGAVCILTQLVAVTPFLTLILVCQ